MSLIQGFVRNNVCKQLTVIDPKSDHILAGLKSPQAGQSAHSDLNYFNSISTGAQYINQSDLIILATKPQSMSQVAAEMGSIGLNPKTILLSIAAGLSLARLEDLFQAEQRPVIRVMPNTPALIGRGISVGVGNASVTSDMRAAISRVFANTGVFHWIDDESLMDAVTALSGSGPAYVFLLIEAMQQAGIKTGLPVDLASELARHTVTGAAAMCAALPEVAITRLRSDVTSPAGTTQAALDALEQGGFFDLFETAINAATIRSRELGKLQK